MIQLFVSLKKGLIFAPQTQMSVFDVEKTEVWQSG